MEIRQTLLARLNETVAQLFTVYKTLPNPDAMVYELWSARDVLAHLTFWHESFARNVDDLVNGRSPSPLKGRLRDLNPAGVAAMRPESLETVKNRFLTAQCVIQENILNLTLTLIPYKKGSRAYTPEEHLEIVDAHINGHLQDVRKVLLKQEAV